jgi:hypothetical protein
MYFFFLFIFSLLFLYNNAVAVQQMEVQALNFTLLQYSIDGLNLLFILLTAFFFPLILLNI